MHNGIAVDGYGPLLSGAAAIALWDVCILTHHVLPELLTSTFPLPFHIT